MLLVALTITHVYFAILPEKRWITRSMIKGWVTRRELLTHHDPARWEAGNADDRAAAATKVARESA